MDTGTNDEGVAQVNADHPDSTYNPLLALQQLEFLGESAFNRLPDEVIEGILYLVDPNAFASLILLNQKWRRVSQSTKLYSYQLSRCPLYSLSHHVLPSSQSEADFPQLQRMFNKEVQRNLFDAYFRPHQQTIKLISSCPGSYSSFPGGEAFNFVFSPQGRLLLGLSSARIYILDLSSPTVSVRRELKVRRRPTSAAILDDGSRLAVLSTNDEVNVYDLTGPQAKRVQSFSFDTPVKAIALSPVGSVLAAAYEGHIGLCSPADDPSSTIKRAIKCSTVDSLHFSSDGFMLLGTTSGPDHPSTTVIFCSAYHSVPLDPLTEHSVNQIWTSQIIFPHINTNISHAMVLPHGQDGETGWILVWDHSLQVFRASPTEDDLTGGFVQFSGPQNEIPLKPTTLPDIERSGTLVATGFSGKDVYIYGVPEDLTTVHGSIPSIDATDAHDGIQTNSLAKLAGRHLVSIEGLTAMRWVGGTEESCRRSYKRLVAVAPGGVNEELEDDEAENVPVDGGRIVIFDFDHHIQGGEKEPAAIEVGEQEVESLEEEERDIEVEVALARRRSIAQGHGIATSSSMTSRPATSIGSERSGLDRSRSRLSSLNPAGASRTSEGFLSPSEEHSEETEEALDAPYDHSQPRSRTALHRAATVAAASRRYNPPRVAAAPDNTIRTPNLLRDPPHESDSDNWVPPPPPYTPNPEIPLPQELLLTLLPRHTEPVQPTTAAPIPPARASTLDVGQGTVRARPQSTIERLTTSLRISRSSPTSPADSAVGTFSNPSTHPQNLQTLLTERELPPLPSSPPSPMEAVEEPLELPVVPRASEEAMEHALVNNRYNRLDTHIADANLLPSTGASSLNVDTAWNSSATTGFPDLSGPVPQMDLPSPESPVVNQSEVPGMSSISALSAPPDAIISPISPVEDQVTPPGFALPMSPLDEPLFPTLPTPEQLSALQSRYSGPSRNISRSSALLSHSHQGYPVPRPSAARGSRLSSVHHRSGSYDRRSQISRSSSQSSSRSGTQQMHTRPANRPPMQRLDTIRSLASARSPSEQHISPQHDTTTPRNQTMARSGPSLRRMPSRAERSAKINLNEAKKRGWSGPKKKDKSKAKNKGGTEGEWGEWTDVDVEVVGSSKKEKGQKCIVM